MTGIAPWHNAHRPLSSMAKSNSTTTTPPTWRRLQRFAWPALFVLLAILGTAHILVRTSTYGAALGNDAFNYLSAAESLVAGEGLLSPGGGQMVLFAPLFTVAMAFLSLFGIEPVDGGRLLNAAAFGLLILGSGLWLRRRLESPWVALAVAVAVLVALPLAHSASTLLSEPLFILFTILALMPLESFLNRRSGKRALALAIVFAALAALTRYLGVVLIFSGVLMLLMRRDIPLRKRLRDALAFGAISSLPLAIAMTRNYLVSGTFTGNRAGASGQPLFDALGQIAAVFQQWADPIALLPLAVQDWPAPVVIVLLLLAALLIITALRRRESAVFCWFALAYLAVIAVVTPFSVGQGVDSRYLSPVYVPLLFVAAFWLDWLLHRRVSGRRASGKIAVARWALLALALLAGAVHIGISAQQNLRLTAAALESGYIGQSLNTAYWQDSELVEYLRANPTSGRYYSNQPNVLRWNAGITGTLVTWVPIPRQNLGDLHDCQRWFERAIRKSQQRGDTDARIVWVGQGAGSHVNCTLLHMESPLPLEPVAELPDGIVFRLNPAFDSAAARQSAYDALVSSEPVISSNFDVYLNKNRLLYVREPCAPADTEPPFFLHLFPAKVRDLPGQRRLYGFDNWDFSFDSDGRSVVFDGKCLVPIALPDYDVIRIRTGQYVYQDGTFNRLWEEEFLFTPQKQAPPQ